MKNCKKLYENQTGANYLVFPQPTPHPHQIKSYNVSGTKLS